MLTLLVSEVVSLGPDVYVLERLARSFFGCIPIECKSRTTRLTPRSCAADIPPRRRRPGNPREDSPARDKPGKRWRTPASDPERPREERAETRVAKTLLVRERPRAPPKGSPIPPNPLSTPMRSLIASPCI